MLCGLVMRRDGIQLTTSTVSRRLVQLARFSKMRIATAKLPSSRLDMKSPTANKLADAANHLEMAVQALRLALPDASNLEGDCICDRLIEATELTRQVRRLADVIEKDAK